MNVAILLLIAVTDAFHLSDYTKLPLKTTRVQFCRFYNQQMKRKRRILLDQYCHLTVKPRFNVLH